MDIVTAKHAIPHHAAIAHRTAVKAAKPTEKARKIYGERGLFLFVPPTGARLWRMKYKIGGARSCSLSANVPPRH